MENSTKHIIDSTGLHTCGLKAFVETEKAKKEKLIREKSVVKK